MKLDNNVLIAISSMKKTIDQLNQQKHEIDQEIAQLQKSITTLYKFNDICMKCDGKRYVYDYSQIEGDPYGRSSDAKVTCEACNGTGLYNYND